MNHKGSQQQPVEGDGPGSLKGCASLLSWRLLLSWLHPAGVIFAKLGLQKALLGSGPADVEQKGGLCAHPMATARVCSFPYKVIVRPSGNLMTVSGGP